MKKMRYLLSVVSLLTVLFSTGVYAGSKSSEELGIRPVAVSCEPETADPDISSPMVSIASVNSSISLNKSRVSLSIGKTTTLKASFKGNQQSVTWKSSDPSVAKVSSSGKITTLKAGSCRITAQSSVGSCSCHVTVTKEPWKDAYQYFLVRQAEFYCQGFHVAFRPSAFALVDLNGDGTPELVTAMRQTGCDNIFFGGHCHLAIYKYSNKKVVSLNGVLTKKPNTYMIRYQKNQKRIALRSYSGSWRAFNYNGNSIPLEGTYTEIPMMNNVKANRTACFA